MRWASSVFKVAPAGLATRIVYVELARPVKATAFLGILREACFTRLNVGLVSAAMIVALLVLLFSARRTGAKALPDPTGKTITPVEFADLAFAESDDENAGDTETVPAAANEASPKSSVATTPVVAAPAQMVPVKPVAFATPRAVSPQPVLPMSAAAVPMDSGDGTQGNQRGHLWPQRPGGYFVPRVPPVAAQPYQTSGPIVFSNSASATLVRVQPNLMLQPQPGSPTRTMAAAEPEASSPPPFVIPQSSQSVRTSQRSVTSSRLNDPRKRDRQP